MNTFAASPLFPFAASRRRRSPEQLLGFRPTSRRVIAARVSVPGGEVAPPSPSPTVTPLYNPTPPDRALRTPHSGYYFDGSARLFFEGWYFKVSIRECRETFCFMYSVENPAFPNGMSALDKAIHGPRFTGVGAQILGAHDKYICRHELMLGNTFVPGRDSAPPNKEVPPQEFSKHVLEGFQVSPIWHQGFIRDDGRSKHVQTVQSARWEYSTRPVYGWGDVKSKQKSTAGWLAAFPDFEPHWQICMACGLSTDWSPLWRILL